MVQLPSFTMASALQDSSHYETHDCHVLSSDNIHTLHGIVYRPRQQPPRGILHIVHGMTEHIGRYAPFMAYAASQGYVVCGYDNLGHGKTANTKEELGFIAYRDGWEYLVQDVFRFSEEVRRQNDATLPYFLMGHSMGSFIVRVAAQKYVIPKKLILMGTGGPNHAAPFGYLFTKCCTRLFGPMHISNLVYALAFGTYNKHFRAEHDIRSWLSIDTANRTQASNDPLCSFRFTTSAMQDLIQLNIAANRKTWFTAMGKRHQSIFLLSGTDDPVGANGKGVKKVAQLLQQAGADVQLKLYDGYRHEILNDGCKEEVAKDLLSYLENP